MILEPKGIRQNNPGNILWTGHRVWTGQSMPHPGGRFCWFDAPLYGMRAMLIILENYQCINKLSTLQQFVDRWAPPVENDTGNYVVDVCDYMTRSTARGIHYDSRTILHMDGLECVLLAQAIVHHENGEQPYTPAQWNAAHEAIHAQA